MLLVFHDIIIDGWSVTVSMEVLSELYAAELTGDEVPPREAKFEFFDFAERERLVVDDVAAKRRSSRNGRKILGGDTRRCSAAAPLTSATN